MTTINTTECDDGDEEGFTGEFNYKRYWDNVFVASQKSFIIRQKKMSMLNNKKCLLPTGGDIFLNSNEQVAYEMELFDSNFRFLDLDCFVKDDQKTLFDVNLLNKLKNINLYVEKTINSGVHILLPLHDKILNLLFKTHDVKIKSPSCEIIFEIKQKCIIFPTNNYWPVSVPKNFANFTSLDELISFLISISSLVYKKDIVIIESIVKRLLRTFNYAKLYPNKKHFVFKKDLIKKFFNKTSSDWFETDVIDDFQLDCNEKLEREYINKKSVDDVEEDNEEDDDEEVDEDEECETGSSSIDEDAENLKNYFVNEKNEDSGIVDDTDLFIPTNCDEFSKNFTVEKSSEIFGAHHDGKGKKKKEPSYVKLMNKINSETGQPQVVSLEEANINISQIMTKKILENLQLFVLDELEYKRISYDIVVRLDCFFTEVFGKRNICGDDVRFFLEMLMLTDSQRTVHSNSEYTSIFATLADYTKWKNWLISYVRITNFMIKNNIKIGANSNYVLNDFKLYYTITRLNSVGFSHTYEEELAEYNREKARALKHFSYPATETNILFYFFVCTTLSVIELNADSVTKFVEYVKQFKNNEDLELLKLRFFDIKMNKKPIPVKQIMDRSERGVEMNTTYMWFDKLPWFSLNSEYFSQILKKFFPNTKLKELLVQNLSSSFDFNQKAYNVELKRWKNKYPCDNGVWDFQTPHSNGSKSTQTHYFAINSSVFNPDSCEKQQHHSFKVPKHCYSTFRNYKASDGVVTPIPKTFSFDDYNDTFLTTKLLSLENHKRYSKEFCFFMKCLFGEDIETGSMGQYNYCNMIALMFNLSLGSLRTNSAQNATVLYGQSGGNGKTQFNDIMLKIFGAEKFCQIYTSVFFKDKDINQQSVNLEEAMFLYDSEANSVNLAKFKEKSVGGQIAERGIYETLNRGTRVLSAHTVLSTNTGIVYQKPNDTTSGLSYDSAFARRNFLIQFLNCFTGIKSDFNLMTKNNINLKSEDTMNRICVGFMFYMIDIIHVFNLGNLDTSITEYITIPWVNKRVTGSANYMLLKTILDKYMIVNEICTQDSDYESIDDIQQVSLYNLIDQIKKTEILENVNLIQISHTLKKEFGLTLYMSNTETLPTCVSVSGNKKRSLSKKKDPKHKKKKIMNAKDESSDSDDFCDDDDSNDFIVEQKKTWEIQDRIKICGLKEKSSCSNYELEVYQNPHKNLLKKKKEFLLKLYETDLRKQNCDQDPIQFKSLLKEKARSLGFKYFDNNDLTDSPTDSENDLLQKASNRQEFVEQHIPKDHRFKFYLNLQDHFYYTITQLLLDEPIVPICFPRKDPEFVDFTKQNFLDSLN